jgi:hypothetical protein
VQLYRITLIFQGAYILLTALWPLIDIESFMMVTGYKTDVWLVKTVGALLIPVGLCLLSFLRKTSWQLPAFILGAGTAIAFMVIDVYYALNDVISDIYLADAVVKLIFLVIWSLPLNQTRGR